MHTMHTVFILLLARRNTYTMHSCLFVCMYVYSTRVQCTPLHVVQCTYTHVHTYLHVVRNRHTKSKVSTNFKPAWRLYSSTTYAHTYELLHTIKYYVLYELESIIIVYSRTYILYERVIYIGFFPREAIFCQLFPLEAKYYYESTSLNST